LDPTSRFGTKRDGHYEVAWEDGDRAFCRALRQGADGDAQPVLTVVPAAERPAPATLDRLAHEYALKDELDEAFAVRPLALEHDRGRTLLVLEDPGGEPLERLLGAPLAMERFLPLAIGVANVLGNAHQRGLIHKDIKPANILVNSTTGDVKLTGFGIASRLLRERQPLGPPESIAGTLAYMAPEQTGRMNRSVDLRSDLYSLGVTLYQAVTGSLPFTASEPMEWVHCHIARNPLAPCERVPNLPSVISAIVMKLMAKSAEDRYQTAAGLEHDLRRCRGQWEARHRIDDFPLGESDTPDRLLIPEKLYGREREIQHLLDAFERVVATGTPELVLVSGYSGIGKSSVVNELHKALVPPRGLFASGKFDQYKRDIPHATLAQAFQSLVRQLLARSDADLSPWREALREALGQNGQLMVELVPELKIIIGDQPPVPDLSPQQAQRRFQLIFRRFISVFAQPEHPLALFLDDLQWLDAATLDLLEDLFIQRDVGHLMLIGAYRENEVDAAHPLVQKLDAVREAGALVQHITLAPLTDEHLGRLLADALRCNPEAVGPLAKLVRDKTGGNPFFAIQFLSALAEEKLLAWDHGTTRWSWHLDRIQAKGYTDNVVDLMVDKLSGLPAETRHALQLLACLGDATEIRTLSLALGTSEAQVHAILREAVRHESIERTEASYRFVHDRFQEAAYSLVPEAERPATHLRIGRLLAAHTPLEKHEEAIFEIVNQLNRGAALVTAQKEREELAQLNLIAGKRAKASTAYASALTYLTTGAALLTDDCWESRHELAFSLEFNRAECEFLTGALTPAQAHLAALSTRAANPTERATVACLRIDVYATMAQSSLSKARICSSQAFTVGLEYLRSVGIDWPPHPTDADVRREYERVWSLLGSRRIEDLVELPLMTDQNSLWTLDVLTKIAQPAYFIEPNVSALSVCRAAKLSLEHGASDGSCQTFVMLGLLVGERFDDYKTGFRFGELGYNLVERKGFKRFQARTYTLFGSHLLPHARHVGDGCHLLRRAFDIASRDGDPSFAAFCRFNLVTSLLAAGEPLVEVEREARDGLAFSQQLQLDYTRRVISVDLGLVRTLRGLTPQFGSFDGEDFDERELEEQLSRNPHLEMASFRYAIRKLQAHFHAGDYASALDASARAQESRAMSKLLFIGADFHFYSALSHAWFCDLLPAGERQPHVEALSAHYGQLRLWAENSAETFENLVALVGAEIARTEGRDMDAMRLYEQAIRSARENRFVHNEALANELASRFYAARGFDEIAQLYLRNARHCYVRWGADGKVRQLDQLHPNLREEIAAVEPTRTIDASIERLDLATVLKVSRAVSGEIVVDKLIATIMQTAIEQAGAGRGLLILLRGADPRIAARATTTGHTVTVHLRDETVAESLLPESVLRYVLRTRETVILDDAAAQSTFAADPYIRERKARSVLCLPLLNQARLIGVLYLENKLAPGVFAPARAAVLKLLASQASISLENSQLYRDLAEQGTKIRRLVDSNIIGIFISNLDGQILEANEAFLRMVGYEREDIESGHLSWRALTPGEWLEHGEPHWMAELRLTGKVQPFEKEYARKDGSRVPVLIGGASFEEGGSQGVAFVLDLTERKRGEAALRESEEQWKAVFENNPVMYFMVEASGTIVSVNPFGAEQLGYTAAELIGRPVQLVFHEADRDAVTRNAAICFEQPGQALSWELRKVRKSGEVIWVRETARATLIGERTVLLIVCEDITEGRRTAEALRDVQRELTHANRVAALGQLTASIAHEINQPISGALSSGQAALHWLDKADLDAVRRSIERVIEDTIRAGDVIRGVRTLVKKVPPRTESFDMNEAIREVMVITRGEAMKHDVSVESQLAEGLPLVRGDRVQLQQVMLNLMLNAIEAMSGAGEGPRELRIKTENSKRDVVSIAVHDSGPGLDPTSAGRVFEAFYTTKPDGLGMGLSICHSIVEAHGGRLWFSSNVPRGAVFQFSLPVEELATT